MHDVGKQQHLALTNVVCRLLPKAGSHAFTLSCEVHLKSMPPTDDGRFNAVDAWMRHLVPTSSTSACSKQVIPGKRHLH